MCGKFEIEQLLTRLVCAIMEEWDTLYVSLKQWIPTVSLDYASEFISKHVAVLDNEGRETFFIMSEIYCKETDTKNDWFVLSETVDDVEVYKCHICKVPEKLMFIWFKFIQKSVEMSSVS